MLLEALVVHLKQQTLWQENPPPPDAFASEAPFACDTMRFENWLQFIFLPKMRQLIDERLPLPSKIAIAPMALHVWANKPEHRELIRTLEAIDALLNE